MRLAAQAKLGFYPAHPDAIAGIAAHLTLPKLRADEVNIIDPCAGEGLAIRQLADALGIPQQRTYAVELDAGRVGALKANLPEANVLGPASFLGVSITGFSFGLAYVNPPFDNELGGGRREEFTFAERATRLLVGRGVLVLVVPETALAGNRNFCTFLDANYEDIKVLQFPKHCRPYKEIAVIGRKRKVPISSETVYQFGDLHKMEFQWRQYGWENNLSEVGQDTYIRNVGGKGRREPFPPYELMHGWKPNTFKKIAYTDGELEEALAGSPLNALLTETPIPPTARPPLPLGKGHVALLLASGMLDGVVEGPDGPHVVRGTSKKVEYISDRSATENAETGAVTEKVVYSQRIVLTIRAVGEDGEIRTFSDEAAKAEDIEMDEDQEEAA